ncbi:hypothetical protein M0R45_009476 [Rubus argutus]|uniref:Uncharacterized protein n=1 Tax=Rubus argutus TaxID=59490 RepID=A0AAW1Y5Z2_RUBAR
MAVWSLNPSTGSDFWAEVDSDDCGGWGWRVGNPSPRDKVDLGTWRPTVMIEIVEKLGDCSESSFGGGDSSLTRV